MGRSATALELEVDATIATLSAWCYPSDADCRLAAEQACGLVGLDYIESLAGIMTATNADAHTARQKVAAACMGRVADLVNEGAAPRLGVLASGLPDTDDEYEEV